LLINNGALLDIRDYRGETPLHKAAFECNKELVELLILKGADVNVLSHDSETPLDNARKDDVKNLIIKHGGKSGNEL